MIGRLLCWLGFHDPTGPDVEEFWLAGANGRGNLMRPYYHCRRCHRKMRWRINGGFYTENVFWHG